jgi:hypothetical protein
VLVNTSLEQGAGDSGLEESVPRTSLAGDGLGPATRFSLNPDHRPDLVAEGADGEGREEMSAGNFPARAGDVIGDSGDNDGEVH